jgi:spore coat protein SA
MKPIIALVSPPYLPVPAVKGGAVETLIEILAEENELSKEVFLIIFSVYNRESERIAKKFEYSKFYYVKTDSLFEKIWHLTIRVLSKIVRIFYKEVGQIYSSYYNKCFEIIKQESPQFIVVEGGDYYYMKNLLHFIHREQLYLHIHGGVKASPVVSNIFGNIIGVSRFITNEYMRCVKDNNVKGYTVLNCCNNKVFTKKITPSEHFELRKILGLSADDFVVLYCGRIIAEKGVRELLKAINMIHEAAIKLLIIGSVKFGIKKTTPYLREIENLVLQADGRVVFTGYIHNDELYKYYQIADMMAVPSLWEEPCALAVLEGLTAGLPMLVTNSGGNPELVSSDSACIIERNENLIDNLASKIVYLYKNKQMRTSMALAAKKDSERFSREKYYQDFISVFQEE